MLVMKWVASHARAGKSKPGRINAATHGGRLFCVSLSLIPIAQNAPFLELDAVVVPRIECV